MDGMVQFVGNFKEVTRKPLGVLFLRRRGDRSTPMITDQLSIAQLVGNSGLTLPASH